MITNEELQAIKNKLPCEYLREYGIPRELLTWEDVAYFNYKKEKEHGKMTRTYKDYPEFLTEDEYEDFYYLRACVFLKKKPKGDFEGNAKICAEVLLTGGNIVDMFDAGADPEYCACLSHYKLDIDVQREIIDAHVPF